MSVQEPHAVHPVPKSGPELREGSKGPDVVRLQTLLARAGFSPGTIDGAFGPKTKAAVMAFQRARGLIVDGIVGPQTWGALEAGGGTGTGPSSGTRAKIIAEANWGLANAAAIHYEQRRPIDGLNQRHKLPLYTDCSGFVTLCYKWAGASDPNGLNYSGAGYTGTLLRYMSHISQSQVQPGDLVLWARNGDGEHVALVLQPGSDPLLVSHGQESGPYTVRFSDSNRYHAGASVYWLRLSSVKARTLEDLSPEARVIDKSDAPSEEGLQPESEPVKH